MTKPIESFFDVQSQVYKLWEEPSGTIAINSQEIIFQAPLSKISVKTGKWKMYYFVLTKEFLFFLKSIEEPTMQAVMKTEWVRTDYIYKKNPKGSNLLYCIRFIRNMRFTDLWTDNESHFISWRDHLCKVFLQCDFHQKFNTIKMIGKGSFARVYLVDDKDTKQKFAVKAFSKEYLLTQPKGKESLINEIVVMKQLDHQYIMKLEEIHESKNSIYLVLELLQGGELLNYISRTKKLSQKDCQRVMHCIVEALAYMNEKKIMHRDLKPDNMILKYNEKLENCTVKLVDFGLATIYDIPEYLFKRCGTPGFVAPEVINAPSQTNIHYTPQCDVFSAGVIFYILLTEKSPFDGKSFKEILQKNKQCQIDFKNPKLKNNKIAVDLLQRMCEVDPLKRITARDALTHEFFTGTLQNQMIIEQSEEVFKDFNEQNQTMYNQLHTNSLIIRQPIINGRIDTMKDSINSQGIIASFKSMSDPKQNEGVKRESILKFVLMQNTKDDSDNIYQSDKFTKEDFITDSEEEFDFQINCNLIVQ